MKLASLLESESPVYVYVESKDGDSRNDTVADYGPFPSLDKAIEVITSLGGTPTGTEGEYKRDEVTFRIAGPPQTAEWTAMMEDWDFLNG